MEHTKIHLCDNFTQWLIEDLHLTIDIFPIFISFPFFRIHRIKALTREREIVKKRANEWTTARHPLILFQAVIQSDANLIEKAAK